MNEIIPNLFIGDLTEDCKKCPPNWAHLCVLADKSGSECNHTRIQFVFVKDRGLESEHLHASTTKLNKISRWIADNLAHHKKVLVHCGHGVERAPLVVTYYLSKTMFQFDKYPMEKAWQLVQSKRPQAQDRRVWLLP